MATELRIVQASDGLTVESLREAYERIGEAGQQATVVIAAELLPALNRLALVLRDPKRLARLRTMRHSYRLRRKGRW